jgi:hypothetical protein
MIRKLTGILFLGLLLTLPPGNVSAQSALLGMNVEGMALIHKSDVARAREAAVQDALEKAIMQASAKIVSDRIEEEKYHALKSTVIGTLDKYINHYQILAEKKTQEEYFVTLNVVVVLAALKTDFLEMGIIQQEGQEMHTVSLYLLGEKTYTDYARLKNFLLSSPKRVKSIYPVRLERRQALFEVQVFGDAAFLVQDLEKTGRYVIDVSRKEQIIKEIFLR